MDSPFTSSVAFEASCPPLDSQDAQSQLKGKAVDPAERPGLSVDTLTATTIHPPIALQYSPPPIALGTRESHVTDHSQRVLGALPLSTSPSTAAFPSSSFIKISKYPPLPLPLSTRNISEKSGHSDNVSNPIGSGFWFPRITPYRLFNLLIPAILGTAKAVATEKGSVNLPITLEWISGIVVFLILTFAADYEFQPDCLPLPIAWIFKIDCMESVWIFLEKLLSVQRPRYISSEHTMDHSGRVVTLYRLIVTGATLTFGVTKANLAYSGYAVGTNWVDWCYGVVVTSILYFIGLYEGNSTGMLRSLFAEDRSHFLTLKPKGFPLVIAAICTIVILTVQLLPAFSDKEYEAPVMSPVFYYPPLLALTFGVVGLTTYQWWTIVRRVIMLTLGALLKLFPRSRKVLRGIVSIKFLLTMHRPKLLAIGQMSLYLFINVVFGTGMYIMVFDSQNRFMPKTMLFFVETMVALLVFTMWFFLAGGWIDAYMYSWWPFNSLRRGLPARGVITVVIQPPESNGQLTLAHRVCSKMVILLDGIVIFLHVFLSLSMTATLVALFVIMLSVQDKAYYMVKLPALLSLAFAIPFTCWGVVTAFIPPLLAEMTLSFSLSNRLHWSTLALFDEIFEADDFFCFEQITAASMI